MKLAAKNTMQAALIVGLVTLLVYARAASFDFTNYDDPGYVTSNLAIRKFDPEFLKRAFTTSEMGWWMPLVWISFAFDYLLWGLNAAGFHLTNIILHGVNSALLVVLADMVYRRIFGDSVADTPGYLYRGALILAGLLFGIHPVHVESVAWVTERKNVLSNLFILACVISYLSYLRSKLSGDSTQRRVSLYLFSLVCFALSLMTKPVAVMVPAMLLIADWYPYDRLRRGALLRVAAEKLPFFALAGLSAFISIFTASGERVLVPLSLFPLLDRFILSGYSVFEYCRLLIFPKGIVLLYLIPLPLPTSYTVKSLLVLGVTLFLLSQARKRPWLLATWFGFLLPLLPSLHFFLNGACSICTHFLYLPAIVPCIAASALLFVLCRRLASHSQLVMRMLVPVTVLSLLLFFLAEHQLCLGSWRNSGTLWTRVIEREPVGRAYYYRSDYYMETGRYSEAVQDLETSVKLAAEAGHPEIYTLHALLGESLRKAGRNEEAVAAFSRAIAIFPVPNFFYYRSLALRQLGHVREADEDLMMAGPERGPIIWQYIQNRDDLRNPGEK